MSAPVHRNAVMRMLWPHFRPHTRMAVFALVLNCLSGLAISIQTLAPKYLIDDVLMPGKVLPPDHWQRLAWLVAGYLLVTIVLRMLLWHWSFRIFSRIRETVLRDLRSYFFRHINHLCLRFHLKHNSGELFSYLFGSPLTQVQQFFHQATMLGAHCIFTVMGTLVWVFWWDGPMSVVLVTSVLLSVFVADTIRKRNVALHSTFQESERAISGKVADLIRGSRHIKLYAIEDQVIRSFDEQASLMGQKGVERDVRGHLYWMRAEAVGYAGFAALCAAGAWRFWGGHITVGEMSAYLSAYIGIQGPLSTVFQIVAAQGAAQASLERMASILDTLSTTPEPNETERHDIPLKGDITVEEVSFAYTSQPVFEDLQLVIPYGQKIALVGSSGSGKSTLSQLIMRLYDPQKGRIRLGGIDLRQCDGKQLRRSFGVVPQDPYFFQASLLDNVRLMKPGATEKEVQAALEKANAWDFVQQQAEGLKTPVGEGGTTLSGGQKQRLAIARALLIDPPYYIFDEATSALDTVSERLIQEAIGRVLLGKTALVIAHRLGTVRMCDRIVVMDKGKIVQDGTYDDLAQREGLFRRMVQEDVFKEGSET